VEHSVRIVKDGRPRIAFRGKTPAGPATVGKSAVIRWQAQDDYGLGKIWLVYTVTAPGQTEAPKEHRIELRGAEGLLSDENSYTWEPAKDFPDLQPGQQIGYYLETSDLKPDEKGERVARSPVRGISILSNDEYLQWYRRELAESNDRVKSVLLSEAGASEQIKKLLKEKGGDRP